MIERERENITHLFSDSKTERKSTATIMSEWTWTITIKRWLDRKRVRDMRERLRCNADSFVRVLHCGGIFFFFSFRAATGHCYSSLFFPFLCSRGAVLWLHLESESYWGLYMYTVARLWMMKDEVILIAPARVVEKAQKVWGRKTKVFHNFSHKRRGGNTREFPHSSLWFLHPLALLFSHLLLCLCKDRMAFHVALFGHLLSIASLSSSFPQFLFHSFFSNRVRIIIIFLAATLAHQQSLTTAGAAAAIAAPFFVAAHQTLLWSLFWSTSLIFVSTEFGLPPLCKQI